MEEEPKVGLMVSLVLMNLTAVALFFLTAPPPKRQDSQLIEVKPVEMVVGDAENLCNDGLPIMSNESALESSRALKGLETPNTQHPHHRPESGHGEMLVLQPMEDTYKVNEASGSAGPKQPPLAVSLKKLVENSKSGVIRLFEGFKNGYNEWKLSAVNETSESNATSANCGIENPGDKNYAVSSSFSSEPESQELTDLIWGSWDDDTNQDIRISTEVVMDVLSRTQRRTAELIEVFSRKVVPAIERMNDKVAEAIRLEKNLDAYTSTLICAIDNVVSPRPTAPNMESKNRRASSGIKKSKHTKSVSGDHSLIQDPQIHNIIGNFSKEERSECPKRPVFKTMAARCLHFRSKKISRSKKSHKRPGSQKSGVANNEKSCVDPVDDIPENHLTNLFKSDESPVERTIGIEDVLALTSSLEHNYDWEMPTRYYPETCDFSMYPRMTIETPFRDKLPNVDCAQSEAEENVLDRNSICDRPNLFPPSQLEYLNVLQQQNGSLASDSSIVGDSCVQGYDSCIGPKESETSQYFLENETQNASTLLKEAVPETESQCTSEKINKTNDLGDVIKRLDVQEKELAVENLCLLVLRMFDAWSECHQRVTSVESGKISLSCCSSKEEETTKNRPPTAIFKSASAQNTDMNFPCDMEPPVPDEHIQNPTTPNSDPMSIEISRDLVQCAVEAAEVQIAERSLKDAKTSIFRNPPVVSDRVCLGLPDPDGNFSGFGDMKVESTPGIEKEPIAVSKSFESVTADSKESSSATFYTEQPESSEDAFYECISSMSAGTYGLEVEDSSKVFLERIQEEGAKVRQARSCEERPIEFPGSSFSIESWLTESGEELRATKEEIESREFSDSSSVDVGCGTDDEAFPSNSTSRVEFGTDASQKGKQKKKKWGTKLLQRFLKKKNKPSFPADALSHGASRSQSDSAVVKLSDQIFATNVDEQTQ